ncbi:ABC transporter substrate-binding protein [soil metagenome]
MTLIRTHPHALFLAVAAGIVFASCSREERVPQLPEPDGEGESASVEPPRIEEPEAEVVPPPVPSGPPLMIACSDRPGWVAWEIAVAKGWFLEEGVAAEFLWFDYVASLDAYDAGRSDAVCMTNVDALVTGATGKASVAILIHAYSDGNDMVVAGPAVGTMADLRGKKVGLEKGFVGHLLFLRGAEQAGLTVADFEIVNMPTDETPEALESGAVDAVSAWQPSAGQALEAVDGAQPVFTSADAPGLIYDLLSVDPQSLQERRDDWMKVVKVWYRVIDYLQDESNREDVLAILSARLAPGPSEDEPLFRGTRFLSLEEAVEAWGEGDGLGSVYGSTRHVDEFKVKYRVYDSRLDIESYLDPSLTLEFSESMQ